MFSGPAMGTESVKIQSRLKGAAAPIALSIAMMAQPVLAQDDDSIATVDSADDADAVIIVTGSRIARSQLNEPNPITGVNAEQIERSGDVNVVDTLVRNPALLGSVGSAGSAGSNTGVGLGYTGVNLLDLRNLGVNRTLVLVNGKRHVAGVPESAAVDISSVPQDLIERIDVLTGGASAIYGADGVSGVVNFVLKRDFEGLNLRAQTGWTTYGDGNQTLLSATAGKNFADGRGNIAVSYEYARQERVDTRDRNYLGNNSRFYGLIRNPDDIPDDPNVPDRILIGNTGWADSSMDGAVDLDLDGIPDYTGSGKVYDRGQVLSQSGGLAIGGSNTPRAGYYGDIVPETERHVGNALFSYELSPAIRFFAEGKYAKMKAFSISQPSFDFYTVMQADNFYLNDRFGDLVQGPALLSRDNFDLGQRGEYNDRETWRVVAGFEGEISDHARYEISYVYGETSANVRNSHARIADRYFAALDSIDDGTGKPVCRIDVDGTGIIDPDNYGGPAVSFTPGANSGCVPLNLLGEGVASQAAIDWMTRESLSSSKVTQSVASGSVSGDFGKFFELPGGPIGFAFGAEYRRETSEATFDEYYRNGWYADSAQFANSKGDFDVSEVFGELNVPIFEGAPLAETLSFGAAIRLSDYSSIGSTTAWKVDGVYAPIPDIRFRATYSESVRAPNIGELYGAQAGGYLFIDDPCDLNNINDGTEYRIANCKTLLGGLGLTPDEIANFEPSSDAEANTSILGFSSGNPNLKAEKAKTWTAGVVLRPSFAPRLAMSFDWYNIVIDGAINTATAQDLAELCVDQPTLANQFCPNIDRNPTTGFVTGWRSFPQNVAKFETAGFDATVNYSVPLGDLGQLDSSLVVGYLNKLNYFSSPGATVDSDLSEPYKPQWTAAWDLAWTIGDVTASYSLTWWDKTRRYTTEQLAGNPDISDPKYFFYKARVEHDIRVSADFDDRFTVYGGINNLFNTKPDLALDYPVSAFGRFAYIGVKAKLGSFF